MAEWVGIAATAAAALVGTGASHAATLEIRNAAVRVVVVPEARSDVSVTVTHANPRLPLKVGTGLDGRIIVDGGLQWGWFGRSIRCGPARPGGWMDVGGIGRVAYEDLPEVVARVPMDARVASYAAVFGAVGPADGLDLSASSCGSWAIANVRGPLTIENSGSAQIRAGDAGAMVLRQSGSGEIQTLVAANGLDVRISGSGDIAVARASGPVEAGVSGSGALRVAGGQATSFRARVSGSGDIHFAGRAQQVDSGTSGSGVIEIAGVSHSLDVSLSGSGDMTVGEAEGPVGARVSGSGDLHITRGHVSGSGGVSFGGVADSLDAHTTGSGWVRVDRVDGPIATASSGSGRVVVAQR